MKKHILSLLLATSVMIPGSMNAKVEHILPRPQQVVIEDGKPFALNRAISIIYKNGIERSEL